MTQPMPMLEDNFIRNLADQGASFNDIPPADNLNLKKFPHDFTKLPTVSFAIPNICNDMHSGSIQAGDEWLHDHLRRYAHWSKKHNSLLVVTWDEAAGPDSKSNPIPTIFYGAHIQRGHYHENINHFNVLRTIEDMYGLTPTGAAASATPITDVFGG
jgi:phosphatidylinositol-3-phosphatase